MADKPKFIQITAASTEADNLTHTSLFALEENGDVWSYHFISKGGDKEQWIHWHLTENRGR